MIGYRVDRGEVFVSVGESMCVCYCVVVALLLSVALCLSLNFLKYLLCAWFSKNGDDECKSEVWW